MKNRTHDSQLIHDNVIREAVKHLNQTDFDIYTNPGSLKNAGIGDKYPDIIMAKKGEKTAKFIIEVETADSVNITEANSQWKQYAMEINASFYLLVPEGSKQNAINLCNQVGISARFATYRTDSVGNVLQINFE